jgi:hypothetical protein
LRSHTRGPPPFSSRGGLNQPRQVPPGSREVVYALLGRADSGSFDADSALHGSSYETDVPASLRKSVKTAVNPTAELARCFLRLANLPNYALDRLCRYEATLWRQAGQILFALDPLERRKPQDRRLRFRLYEFKMFFSIAREGAHSAKPRPTPRGPAMKPVGEPDAEIVAEAEMVPVVGSRAATLR